MRTIYNKKGFTILELTVAMAIFVTASVALGSIFVYTNRNQRSAGANVRRDSDARFAFEAMAREARRGNIDYAGYATEYAGPIPLGAISDLRLFTPQGKLIIFKKNVVGSVGVIQVSSDGVAWTDLTSREKTDVISLKFYVYPSTDPNGDPVSSPPNVQPRVVIAASFRSQESGSSAASVTFSTTISSRIYGR